MLREEAEREASRRNREDPDRERFEFYPFDESAGMAPDAWDVAARLRQAPRVETPATPAAAARRRAPAHPGTEVAYAEPPPAQQVEAWPEAAHEEQEWADEEAWEDEEEDPNAPGLIVRSLAAIVMVVGVLWMAMVVALAFVLKPNSVSTLGVYVGAAVLGLVAVGLGVAIRRS
jgi:hypothetical protein